MAIPKSRYEIKNLIEGDSNIRKKEPVLMTDSPKCACSHREPIAISVNFIFVFLITIFGCVGSLWYGSICEFIAFLILGPWCLISIYSYDNDTFVP